MSSYPGKLGYIPALDGLRGVAILLVVFYHASLAVFQTGYLGVDAFFALSGFLITTIIVSEYIRTGAVDLRAFYKRRALRLLPALFAVIAVVLALAYVFYAPDIQKETITQAFTSSVYVSNWVQASRSYIAANPLAITWSLSVEDQFYILWTPVLVLALMRHVGKYKMIAAVILLSALSAVLCFVLINPHEYSDRAFFGTDTRAQALLIGCVAGLLYSWALVPATARAKRILWILCLPGLLFFIYATEETLILEDYTRIPSLSGGIALVSISVAALCLLIVFGQSGMVGSVLAWRPLVWIGSISYGLYLWHGVVFWLLEPIHANGNTALFNICAISLSFLVAALSYRYIERPFLRLKYTNPAISNKPAVQPEVI